MKPLKIFFPLGVLLLALFLLSHGARAETCEKWVAKVVSAQGGVQSLRASERQWRSVKLHETYCPGDRIRVLTRSRADIVLFNETTLRLDQNTTVTFSKPEAEKASLIELLMGAIHFFSRHRRSIRVVTPFVNATVEGTEFYMEVKAEETLLHIFEGLVTAANQAGEIRLTRGQSAMSKGAQPPILHTVARPRDAIQWTLYYPSIFDDRPSDFETTSPASWQTSVQKSIEFYREGDIEKAFEVLSEIVEEVPDPRFFTYRASLLLSVGRVNEARADIEKTLYLKPGNTHALALQSMISVVQNEKQKAIDLARRAVEADPCSAAAHIALSYALQANFDLQGALTSLKDSVKVEPGNALAWARLAELWLSFGKLQEAFKSADKAVSLNPNLGRTQTVLGFAYLTQIKIKKSKEAFEKSIGLDQADPLPRLGLGLAKIREGNLAEGREEIEIAASLDPNSSLIRSYLGKAYYEEKRDKLAADQFAIAKDLDPSDPTSFFYDAIRKQTVNRPVEAHQDMQTSIALNNNRAVYRSRLLLDEDLAAREASLARIYSDLGFQQLALVEGWRALGTDPGNFSTHRFLSDSYSSLPRHEIARMSELLQAQLLQPINIAPLQPHLSQSNLLILSGAGPSEMSFNEFNPLFNRNRIALQASSIVGEDHTWGEEVVLSGIFGRFSYSLGQFHYQTEGFRKNDELREDLYNAFVQVSLSPETSLQAEFRSKEAEFGDRMLRFLPNDFLPNLRQKEGIKGIRVGVRHTFSPGSDLIASAIYQTSEPETQDVSFGLFDFKTDEKSFGGEGQYLFRSEGLNVIAGTGYFRIDRRDISTDVSLDPPQKFVLVEKSDIYHTNLYLYSYLNYLNPLTFTMGASADFFKIEGLRRNQFNPKLGVSWTPLPWTTLRGAFVRALNRTLINNQTIEPTQVAGFNQFFVDAEGTDAWRYGIAIDQKFSKDFFAGAEYSIRNLEVPNLFPIPTGYMVIKSDWEERLGRFYLYWTPHSWLALSAEYYYEKLDREKPLIAGIDEVKTHRLPFGFSFYHPSGLSAMLKTTWVDQSGRFKRVYSDLFGPSIPGEDRFWIVDVAIQYRLPKRYGFLILGAKNLFDRSFCYQDTDPTNPQIQPKRFIYGKFTLSF